MHSVLVMMKVVKVLYAIGFVISLVISVSCLSVWWESMGQPYNAMGRYWDGTVIWQEQAVTAYGLLSLAALAFSVVMAIFWRKIMRL